MAVVGPSGAGKSSLVRAGLLPALAAGVLPGLADARQHLLAPGAPLPALDGPAVVLVDQFEEVFATITDDNARGRYLDDLTALAWPADRTRSSSCAVTSWEHARRTPACAVARRRHRPGRASMRPDEIRRAVELPARHVGLHSEPALVDAIVSDMQDAPGRCR